VAAKHVIKRLGATYDEPTKEEEEDLQKAANFAMDNLREQLIEKNAAEIALQKNLADAKKETEAANKTKKVMVGLSVVFGGVGLVCLAMLVMKQIKLRQDAEKVTQKSPQSTAITAV
jgi:ferric-dicitrate binding protein FerR (iron transport regulator)